MELGSQKHLLSELLHLIFPSPGALMLHLYPQCTPCSVLASYKAVVLMTQLYLLSAASFTTTSSRALSSEGSMDTVGAFSPIF